MNGVLSGFPTGILGQQDPMMDPRTIALLQTGLGLMQAGGPSRTPVSLGQAFGQAGQQGVSAFQKAQDSDLQRQLLGLKIQKELKPENPFGKVTPDKYTPESWAKFTQTQNYADLVPVPDITFTPGGQAVDKRTVAPGTTFANPNQPFSIGQDGQPQPNQQFQDYDLARRRAGATQVNVGPTGIDYGPPPKDMAWARDESGRVKLEKDPKTGHMRPVAVPVAGGSVQRDADKAEEARRTQQKQQERYADILTEDVDRALEIVKTAKIPVTGFGALASAVPGTPAHNLSKLVDTIKANVGFDRLQQMRNASPTGGALGQVSEFENRLLQATIGNLEQSQSEEQYVYNLKRVKDTYLDVVHGPGNRPAKAPAAAPQNFPPPTPDAVRRLKMNPREKEMFDKVFGPGAADKALGKK